MADIQFNTIKPLEMRTIIILIAISFLLQGCMTSNFTLTGTNYNSLPVNSPVKVVLTGSIEAANFEEIGVLQVKQTDMDNLSMAVELAKKRARIRGGDIVYLITSSNSITTSNSIIALSNYQALVTSEEKNTFIFIIGKQKN
mgnify:CR=1 FL=1